MKPTADLVDSFNAVMSEYQNAINTRMGVLEAEIWRLRTELAEAKAECNQAHADIGKLCAGLERAQQENETIKAERDELLSRLGLNDGPSGDAMWDTHIERELAAEQLAELEAERRGDDGTNIS